MIKNILSPREQYPNDNHVFWPDLALAIMPKTSLLCWTVKVPIMFLKKNNPLKYPEIR